MTTETKALLTNVVNPWRYAGQYFDTSTGLYKMGARYYQPELGRWTQRDPSGQDANAYAYVGGNPVNFVDPTGTVRTDYGNISYSIYTSITEARRIHALLSDPDAGFIYGGTAGIICAIGGGALCGAFYTVLAYVAQDTFSEAFAIGGCVQYKNGLVGSGDVKAVPPSDPFCDY